MDLLPVLIPMLDVLIPDSAVPERRYILHILLGEILGLEYRVRVEKVPQYQLMLENGRVLIVEDAFFSKYGQNYLRVECLPDRVLSLKTEYACEDDILVLYGRNELTEHPDTIFCAADLFAASFYMLTRWEEIVIQERDKHGRFPAEHSLAYRLGFLNRPIVNEYAEFLWKLLHKLGIQQQRRVIQYETVPSHDIDVPFQIPGGQLQVFKYLLRNAAQGSGNTSIYARWNMMRKIKRGMEKDPYDTYEDIMDISEKNDLRSEFYFKSSTRSSYDFNYRLADKRIIDLMRKIRQRGHVIGFHPGYYTVDNASLWQSEKRYLDDALQRLGFEKTICGRQHYLRFDVPRTWQLWEDNGMTQDMTMTYASREGFRCGICLPYTVFNVLSRKHLKITEQPLIVMDGSFMQYQSDLSMEGIYTRVHSLKKTIRKYHGVFTILAHNTAMAESVWPGWNTVYKNLLSA